MSAKRKPKESRRVFKAIPLAPGVAIGKVHMLDHTNVLFPRYWINDREVPSEVHRFKKALEKTRDQLSTIREKLCKFQGRDQIQILDSHRMILQDEMITSGTIQTIANEKINAEWGLDKTFAKLKGAFYQSGENIFQERRADIESIGNRIIKNLMGGYEERIKPIARHKVIVAHELAPADTAQMVKGEIEGFVTEIGGKTSHTAIVARALEMPAIAGISQITKRVKEGDFVIIDGTEGILLVNPNAKDRHRYQTIKKKYEQLDRLLLKEINLPTETQDGVKIRLAANMELTEEIDSILQHGAEGIGLYRTEYLFLGQNRLPTEDEHFASYKNILTKMAPHPVTIRTLDIGGDKIFAGSEYHEDANPALGLRAIRFCLRERDLFKTQLKALLRASVYGHLRILIPMISGLDEIKKTRKILQEAKDELAHDKIPFSDQIKLGIMIEVPSAALIANRLAYEVDFFSIGTNDLIQYTLAIDRVNEHVANLYDPLHPAILRLIKEVIDAARAAGIEVSLCGEMAGEPLYIMLLVGFGLNELSMNPLSVPRVKKILREITYKQATRLVETALTKGTSQEVEHLIRKEMTGLPFIL